MSDPDITTLKVMALKRGRSAQPVKPVVNSVSGGQAVPLDTVEPTETQPPIAVARDADMVPTSEGTGPADAERSPGRVLMAARARALYGGTLLVG